MSDARPAAVFFDLGKVLVDFDWRPSLRQLAERVGVAPDAIAQWLLGPGGPHDAYCLGQIDDAELFDRIHARLDPSRELDDAWLRQLWCAMFTPIDDSLALVDALRGQCHLGLITNTNALHFESELVSMRLGERFDAISASHQVGAMKPDPAIFEHALTLAGCEPSQAFFIDDIEEFVQAARDLDLDAYRFEGAPALATRLKELGFELSAPA